MIIELLPHHDQAVADFWVQAWQQAYAEIDFEARRPWILGHLAEMRVGKQIVRGYFAQDQPIGFYSLFAQTGLVEQLCVNPQVKGRGIGAALMADAASQTACPLSLVVNEDNHIARRFYAKHGFVEIGRGHTAISSRANIAPQMSAKTPP